MVIWPIDEACGIHFRDVFADDIFNDIELKIIELKRYYDSQENEGVCFNIRKGHFIKAAYVFAMKLMNMLQENKRQLFTLVFRENYFDYEPPEEIGWTGDRYREYSVAIWKQVKESLENKKETYIHAYCGIIKEEASKNIDLSVLKFQKEYWKKVKEIINPKEKYIGIHIRRTDHMVAAKASSTKAFVERIDTVLKEREDVKFFLATDDPLEEETFKKMYGDRLIVQTNKKWGRTNSDEMKSGITDCLCLSCCECILGSYMSVFSSFAARYGKKKLIICKDEP